MRVRSSTKKKKLHNSTLRTIQKQELSRLSPYCESFQHPSKLGCSKSQWGKPFHNVCNQHSLAFSEMRQSVGLCSRPREPSPIRQWGKPGRIECSQYRYRRFLLNVTWNKDSKRGSTMRLCMKQKTQASLNQSLVYRRLSQLLFKTKQNFKDLDN